MPKSKNKLTAKELAKKKFPQVLIPGLIAAIILGWSPKIIQSIKDYRQLKNIFPSSGVVEKVEDGDTFILKNGVRVRLIGIDAPTGTSSAEIYLMRNVLNQKVFLEYDRYQDDKYGRILAWVWIGCESAPQFLPADYMHKSGNESNLGLTENPKGCKKGKLVNEELVNKKYVKVVSYQDRGKLKYEDLLKNIK